MQNRTCRKWVYLIVGMAFLLIPGQALAKDGWYMAMDLGVAVASGPDTRASDTDYPTTCDQFILDPAGTNDGTHSSLAVAKDATDGGTCEGSNEKWTNEFDGGTGVLAGLAVGYRWQNLRVEGEYFFRNTDHDSSSEPNFGGNDLNIKVDQEIAISEEVIDDVLSHNFFANMYYDFALNPSSKWTPYLGVGVGFAQVSMDYFNRFTRSSNPENIQTFKPASGNKGALDYKPSSSPSLAAALGRDPTTGTVTEAERTALGQSLAGTTSIGRSNFSDTLFGYQLIAGVDYRISEPVTIGLKFRWVDLGELEDSDEYSQLRSHDATNSNFPGSPRVRYTIVADDIQFWGLSLNMKYHF